MTKKRPDEPPRFRVWLKPSVHKSRHRLPANVRQRIKAFIDELGHEPRPTKSRELRLPDTTPSRIRQCWEVRRAKIDNWRVLYVLNETWKEVGVLRIAKRPPYRYEDLDELLEELDAQ